jgi:hypothetical protein
MESFGPHLGCISKRGNRFLINAWLGNLERLRRTGITQLLSGRSWSVSSEAILTLHIIGCYTRRDA